ncbi:MAG: xanthine dehydrogenase family protein subunit M [Deltaproteobacteria bacterium]|nr:xanthine dehydrogenase family protein subunit M [Deltaproteobacteria bacterium]
MILPFTLHRPDSVESAASLLDRYGGEAKILAGGSELILLLKMGLASYGHLVDIKKIPGLDFLDYDPADKKLRIGALVTHRALELSSIVQEHFPLVRDMERQLANVRIRNAGTLAANLCFAEPKADPGTLLLAYGASIKARNAKRERSLSVDDFFVDYYKTALDPDEILTEVQIPKLPDNFRGAYLRFCPGERPTVTAAVLVRGNGSVADEIRIALGCVGPKPVRAREVEEDLKGKGVDEIFDTAMEAGEKATLLSDPLEDLWGSVEYKRHIVKVLVGRGLRQLCQRKERTRG